MYTLVVEFGPGQVKQLAIISGKGQKKGRKKADILDEEKRSQEDHHVKATGHHQRKMSYSRLSGTRSI